MCSATQGGSAGLQVCFSGLGSSINIHGLNRRGWELEMVLGFGIESRPRLGQHIFIDQQHTCANGQTSGSTETLQPLSVQGSWAVPALQAMHACQMALAAATMTGRALRAHVEHGCMRGRGLSGKARYGQASPGQVGALIRLVGARAYPAAYACRCTPPLPSTACVHAYAAHAHAVRRRKRMLLLLLLLLPGPQPRGVHARVGACGACL